MSMMTEKSTARSTERGLAFATSVDRTEVRILARRLRDLSQRLERQSQAQSIIEADGWAPELCDALDRIECERATIASRMRKLAAEVEAVGLLDAVDDFVPRAQALLDLVDHWDTEESRLFARAFWLDIGGSG